MRPPTTKRLVIANNPDEAARVLQEMLADVQARGYSDDVLFAIRLSMDEALNNAVQHGNCGDPDKTVIVEYTISDDSFKASVTDEGCGFVPDRVPDPTCDENLDRPRGRGVMLMKAYMSEVSFNERGNCVTLVKHRQCKLPIRTKP